MPFGPRITIYYGFEIDAEEAANLLFEIYEDSGELEEVYYDNKTFRDYLESEDGQEVHKGLDAFSVTTFTIDAEEYEFVVAPHDHPGTGYFVGKKVVDLSNMSQNGYALPELTVHTTNETRVQDDLDDIAEEPYYKYVAIGTDCTCCQ